MESLVYAVVHDNTNLRACLEGSELNKSFVNVPTAEDTAILLTTDNQHASTYV